MSYQVRFDNLGPQAINAIRIWVPDKLNKVAEVSLTARPGIAQYWFGDHLLPGSNLHLEFDRKRRQMNEFLNSYDPVSKTITFAGRNVPQGQGAPAMAAGFMRQSCFPSHGDQRFVPRGIRMHIFEQFFMTATSEDRFNIIAHELTHRILATTDKPRGPNTPPVYGFDAARTLAQQDTSMALTCAENWGYFYENCMRELP
jgi:hypothetical protein